MESQQPCVRSRKHAATAAISRRLQIRGTLLLYKVGELPIASQASLLRALQEKAIEPLGSSKAVKVDVRVIAVANQPLMELMSMASFEKISMLACGAMR